MKILNLHGIYGKPYNTAYNTLKEHFDNITTPAYAYENINPYDIIKEHINNKYDLIVGTSFGGFYASIIGTLTNTKVIGLNPAIPSHPYIPNLVKGYKYTNELIELFNKINFDNITAILGDNDDVIDTTITTKYIKDFTYIKGGHRLSGEEFTNTFNNILKNNNFI